LLPRRGDEADALTAPGDRGALALTGPGCRRRQDRLRAILRDRELDGAILFDPRHVHYLTGHWGRAVFATACYIPVEGPVVLVTAYPPDPAVATDRTITFEADRYATLVDDQPAAVMTALAPFIGDAGSIGCDELPRPGLLPDRTTRDLAPDLLSLRRTKDPDEVAVMRRAIAGCEAAYAAARKILTPGLTEVQLHARLHAAAIEAVGEAIGEFGNDFQAGTPGGAPRDRPIQAGELIPFDLGVVVRGYCSDLCRTFAVGGAPTPAQREAHRLVVAALAAAERMIRPGVSCREVFEVTQAGLDGRNGWRFEHHLGHGIGLAPHEAPRINPFWDDTFMAGDVITVEPGLYGEELRAGVRIEEEYLVTETGVERLSHFPTDL
jgi:Xaa-Pro aminopeptidase